jgi:hypothetical protein
MKRLGLLFLILAVCLMVTQAFAEDSGITLKQGAIASWKDWTKIRNVSTAEVAKTNPVDGWGIWNVLWDGWSLDAGIAYDVDTINTGTLLLGREFGTLGKYLPINFPFKDKITLSLYPVGIQANNIDSEVNINGCSGFAYLKGSIKF